MLTIILFQLNQYYFQYLFLPFSILFFRVLTHFILDSYRSYGGNIKKIAIIGYDKMGVSFYKTIKNNNHLGLRSNGIFFYKSKNLNKIFQKMDPSINFIIIISNMMRFLFQQKFL